MWVYFSAQKSNACNSLDGRKLDQCNETDCKVLSQSFWFVCNLMKCCFLIKIREIYYGRRPALQQNRVFQSSCTLERITLIQDPELTSASLGPNFFSELIKRPCFQYPGTVEVTLGRSRQILILHFPDSFIFFLQKFLLKVLGSHQTI